MAPIGKPPAWYDLVRYRVIPPIFLVFFTGIAQYLALVGRGELPTWSVAFTASLGNRFAWTTMAVFWAWAALWLKVPSKEHLGPATLFGYQPRYQDNGVLYFSASLVGFLVVQMTVPSFSSDIFNNMPQILGCCNIAAILLCSLMWVKGKLFLDHPGDRQEPKPVLYEFYRGMELHPRLLDVDVKQFTNCRIGMMAWQLLVVAFFFAGIDKHGFNAAAAVNMLLQTIYIGKFFYWETGYFNTLDIILDRAGYYICWGCLVWVPCLYTFSSYYIVAHLPIMNTSTAVITALLGIAAILMNYRVDAEKQRFRANPKCTLWGRQCQFISAYYRDSTGTQRESKLLVSGCWGVARHFNYLFELIAALAWCLPGVGLSFWPFSYFIFLVVLLVHRTFRDEEKCAAKYGKDWEKYCKRVPWRIIPYVF